MYIVIKRDEIRNGRHYNSYIATVDRYKIRNFINKIWNVINKIRNVSMLQIKMCIITN